MISPRLRASAVSSHAQSRAVWLFIVAICLGTIGSAQSTSPLVDAVKRGDREAGRERLGGRADGNAATADGTTALHWAVRASDIDLVRTLLRSGANAKASNRYGIAPLPLAQRKRT